MKFKVRFVDQVVGIFVLVALAGIVVLLVFMGFNQRWFARNYSFTSTFASGDGLSVGMPIVLKGFQIGKVTRISLTADNRVDMEFSIQDTYYEKVTPNSVIELVSSPIGLGTSLRFHPGRGAGPPIPEHSAIPTLGSPEGRRLVEEGLVELPQGEDVIGSVLDKVNPILDEVRATLAQAKRLVADVDTAVTGKGGPIGGMVNQLALTPAKVNRTVDLANGVVDRVNTVVDTVNTRVDGITLSVNRITDRTNEILTRIDKVSRNLEDISANLKSTSEGLRDTKGLATRLLDPKGSVATILDDQNALYGQVTDALKNANQIIAQVRSFVDYVNSTKPQISSILEKGRDTLDQGKDVLEAVKNNPLLRGGVPAKREQGPTLKSYRDEDF
jgi:phospholipid/cholesterol/gamma-HCH transport system substrate-binding protein